MNDTLPAIDAALPDDKGFSVSLGNFEGPFDLLLQLISKHQLDITEVALSVVTTEFISYTRSIEDNLEETTQFLLVAATLLDLKTSRLLPQTEVEDEEDLALLEARDLLFARLMQYRAFKQVATILSDLWETQGAYHARAARLEERFAQALPEIEISISPERLAEIAAAALAPKLPPVLSLAHLHAPAVSVREQAHLVVDRLRRDRVMTFRSLTSDATDVMTKVARFLAVLELFREGQISFDQVTPLGELTISWTGTDEGDIDVGDEFDIVDDSQEVLTDDETDTQLDSSPDDDADSTNLEKQDVSDD